MTAIADLERSEATPEEMESLREGEKGKEGRVMKGGSVWKCRWRPDLIIDNTNELEVIPTQLW